MKKKFKKENIDIITNSRVIEIRPDSVVYQLKDSDRKDIELHYGLCLWATGITLTDFTKRLTENPYIKEYQSNKRALSVNVYLNLKGIIIFFNNFNKNFN